MFGTFIKMNKEL